MSRLGLDELHRSAFALSKLARTSRIVGFVRRLMVSRRTDHEELRRNGVDDLFVKRRRLGGSHGQQSSGLSSDERLAASTIYLTKGG